MTLTPATVNAVEIVATLLGAGYVVLAARRNRLCWVAGAVASALLCVLSFLRDLPMQAWLNVYYVGMAAYGWWNWTRESGAGELPVRRWPWSWHLLAALVLTLLAAINARLLAATTDAAWPMLDSLTTWFSLFATWLAARACLENWLYWIVIDAVLAYLYSRQGLLIIAIQFGALTGLAIAGYVAWRRRLAAQAVAA